MKQNSFDAHGIRYRACVLAAGAAERDQCVARRIIAALDGYFLDRSGHVLVGDTQKAFCGCLWRNAVAAGASHFRAKLSKARDHRLAVERLIAIRPEDGWEKFWTHASEQHVAVGNGERPTAAIASGSRIGAGAVWADAQAHSIEKANGAAAGGDGVDLQHRRREPHAGDDGLVGAL